MSSDRIVALRGDWTPGSPSETIIRVLEDELERAKRGEVVALALATIRPNGQLYTSAKCESECMTLLGGLQFLQRDLMSSWGE